MKITAILGSPRAGGNTDILANHVLSGAKVRGFDTKTIALRSLKISPCIGCDKCWEREQPCIFDDDMKIGYDSITASNVLLFATPVYWYGPTAIMKAFIDRLVVFNRPQGRPLIENKSAILVTAYEENGPTAVEPLLKMFELSFNYLGIKFLDRIVVDGAGPKAAVMEMPDVLDFAYNVGLSLQEKLIR